jgi:hypothetical protein
VTDEAGSPVHVGIIFPGNKGTGTAIETSVKRRKKERKIAGPSKLVTSGFFENFADYYKYLLYRNI